MDRRDEYQKHRDPEPERTEAREQEEKNRALQDRVSGNRMPGGGEHPSGGGDSGPIDENL